MGKKYSTITMTNTAAFLTATSPIIGTAFVREMDSYNLTFTSTATATVVITPFVVDGTDEITTGFLSLFDTTEAISLISGTAGYLMKVLKHPNNVERIRFRASSTATIAVGTVRVRIDGKSRS